MRTWSGMVVTTIVAAGVGATVLSAPAQADRKFPAKPVRLVVPFSAGGSTDILARMMGPKMSESWAQPVVVDNRPGAGATLGAGIVAKAAPDGHTLLLTGSALPIAAALQRPLSYDTLKDFSGVADIGSSTLVLVVTPGLGVKSANEFVALARAKPRVFLFGSGGAGSPMHIHAERFLHAADVKARHVGFKGQPQFLIEIAAGRVQFGVATLTVCLPLVADGRLLALAATERTRLLPGVPEIAEVAPGWERRGGIRLVAPAGTPRAVLNQVSQEVARILDLPEIRKRLDAVAFHVQPSTPEEADRSLRADIETFSRVVRQVGLVSR